MQSLKKREGKEISGIMVKRDSQDDNYVLEMKSIQAGMKKSECSSWERYLRKYLSLETDRTADIFENIKRIFTLLWKYLELN